MILYEYVIVETPKDKEPQMLMPVEMAFATSEQKLRKRVLVSEAERINQLMSDGVTIDDVEVLVRPFGQTSP